MSDEPAETPTPPPPDVVILEFTYVPPEEG